MNNDKSTAYFAMALSVIMFFCIVLISYIEIIKALDWNTSYVATIRTTLVKLPFLKDPFKSITFLVLVTVVSVMIYYPKKRDTATIANAVLDFGFGLCFLFGSAFVINDRLLVHVISMVAYVVGYLLVIYGTLEYFQTIKEGGALAKDPFNEENETFLQMEEKIDTEHSVNIAYKYQYGGKIRKGWINFVNLFRALLIIGTPGSGKSFAIIEEIVCQMLRKFYTLVIYDFKFDSLSKKAYNHLVDLQEKYKEDPEKLQKLPKFFVICLDNPEKSHRCNPIDPYFMKTQTDATDASTSIMKNLNMEWIKKNDFFSRSAISFVSGLIWYLKKISEQYGKNYCTLPHVIMLSTVNIEYLLNIMLQDMEVRSLLVPFKDALEREAGQQLAGQTASAQISLSMLAIKEIFYVMSGNDFRLDVNNPDSPKIVCIQNNPDRFKVYAAPIGLYINKIMQIVNKPNQRPMGMIIDELPTIFIMNLRTFIDTARENLCATVLGIQSIAQMIADYGKELADVLYENSTNIFCGAAKGSTAKHISELFGKTNQKSVSNTISSNDTTTNISTQSRDLLPVSKIASMGTGTFAGIVADKFEYPIKQKLCYGEIIADMENKKIQKKHEIPKIKNFEPENYQETVKEKKVVLLELDFYEKALRLDLEFTDYITFYNEYIQEFTQSELKDIKLQEEFISFVRFLKIFDHLPELKKIKQKSVGQDNKKIITQKYIDRVLELELIEDHKDKVLMDNFINIIKDVDNLVKSEYERINGVLPDFSIFDEKKLNSELSQTMHESEELAGAFMRDINKMDTKDILKIFPQDKNLKNDIFENGMDPLEQMIRNASELEDPEQVAEPSEDVMGSDSSFPIEFEE